MRLKHLLVLAFVVFSLRPLAASEPDHLAAFSDPARLWGNGIEKLIEEAYRSCFITRIIDGKIMNIRMPFAANNERDLLSDSGWTFYAGGKGNPSLLWPVIESSLDSKDFELYVKTLSDGREQVIIFDMAKRKWHSSRDLFDIARMKAGSYRGLPHRPYVYSTGNGINENDVYNYLYCVGHTGMDCSAFVWHVLKYVSRQGGVDLGKLLSRYLGVSAGGDPALYVGTSFYNSDSSHLLPVDDRIKNLRPADIILFRGPIGTISHSAIIQSIDYKRGVIRYMQCTDEAPQIERGVHESFIYFNPANTNVSLKDTRLTWTQLRQAPFPGEKASPYANDGHRYRAHSNLGGGRVVRLRYISQLKF